jgi:hypothetical protein
MALDNIGCRAIVTMFEPGDHDPLRRWPFRKHPFLMVRIVVALL